MRNSILKISGVFGLLLASYAAVSSPVCKEEEIKIGRFPVEQHGVNMAQSAQKTQQNQAVLLVKEFVAARTRHDVESALKSFSDHVVWETAQGEILRGKQALKKMLTEQFQDNITNEIIGTPQVKNNKVKLLRKVTMESWKKRGIDYLVEDTDAIIKDGKIVYWKNQYTPESKVKLGQHQGKE